MSIDPGTIRNIGIAAHIDAGKTTTTECIIFYSGRSHRMGGVDSGNTHTDFDVDEQKRGITIYSAAVTCPWRSHTINLIDTPGHVDFTAEVERCLRVLDGMVAVFDAKEGVEAQSETVWRQADKYDVPRIIFINKMDKLGADFGMCLRSIHDKLDAAPVAVQIPIGESDQFKGLIDLLEMKAVYFESDGVKITVTDIPETHAEEAEEWRHKLEEAVADTDDALMEKYIDNTPLDADEIRSAMRRATIADKLHPVFCGSALHRIGVQRLMDGVVDYLPSPLDMPPAEGTDPDDPERHLRRACDNDEPFAALVFKVVADKPVDLFFMRIYSGRIKTSTRVLNTRNGKKENISRTFHIFGKRREQLDEAEAGDIVAVVGLKNTLTGDTLCDTKHPVVLERIDFPDAVISMAIEPVSSADRDRLSNALGMLSRQDPTFRVVTDRETGQTLISGMGELHLEVLVERLRRDMKVGVTVGQPRVSYRETITASAEAEGRFIKQTGGHGQFAVVSLAVEPLVDSEESLEIESKIRGGAINKQYIHAVESGIREAMGAGVLDGHPVVDVKVTILDGKEHDVDSSELAFEHAGRLAFELAMKAAKPQLLEPVMKAEISIPDEYFGAVGSDLAARGATVVHTDMRGSYRVLTVEVPLANMFGYATVIRGLTKGRGTWVMEPLGYRPIP